MSPAWLSILAACYGLHIEPGAHGERAREPNQRTSVLPEQAAALLEEAKRALNRMQSAIAHSQELVEESQELRRRNEHCMLNEVLVEAERQMKIQAEIIAAARQNVVADSICACGDRKAAHHQYTRANVALMVGGAVYCAVASNSSRCGTRATGVRARGRGFTPNRPAGACEARGAGDVARGRSAAT